MRDVTLADGTVIVKDGAVEPGPALNVAVVRFLALGGDQYPFRDKPFANTGITYQQALANYIVQELGGVITGTDYPTGGEGRSERLTSTTAQDGSSE